MPDAVIEAHGLGKRYQLGEGASLSSLRESLSGLVGGGARAGSAPRRELWALRDVSFSVQEGELLGVVGRNGAGKSTLLKILARITEPTEGRARTRGKVGALLEVGTAFHPELTGRENVEINGALLGMTRAEVRRKFDEIVAFAGVEEFLDTPVKRYSSGMYLRLAFAVAAHLEPRIVVVDEVLAVGDAEFQRRCLAKMAQLGREGRTVLFVSHDLGSVGQLCTRTLWIDDGTLRDDGPTEEVLDRYLRATVRRASRVELEPDAEARAQLLEIGLEQVGGESEVGFRRGEPFKLRMTVEVREPPAGLDVAFWVINRAGTRVIDERLSDDLSQVGRIESRGRHAVELGLPPMLPPGEYVLGAWLGTEVEDFHYGEVLTFEVLPLVTDRLELRERVRVTNPVAHWTVDDG